jgi:hypothetical protein
MTDERNIAQDKKVMDDKRHAGEDISEGTVHAPQPGKKPEMEKTDDNPESQNDDGKSDA